MGLRRTLSCHLSIGTPKQSSMRRIPRHSRDLLGWKDFGADEARDILAAVSVFVGGALPLVGETSGWELVRAFVETKS